jgi:hypothetical protein
MSDVGERLVPLLKTLDHAQASKVPVVVLGSWPRCANQLSRHQTRTSNLGCRDDLAEFATQLRSITDHASCRRDPPVRNPRAATNRNLQSMPQTSEP